jgi:hypothetical protein
MNSFYSRPILVTGSHRSGTTWVGKTISLSQNVQYIPDTFAPNGSLRKDHLFSVWFKYLCDTQDTKYLTRLSQLFNFKYTLQEAFHLKNEEGKFDYKNTPARIQFFIETKTNKYVFRRTLRPLLKDPIAIFSADWIYNNFNSQNVVLIRHPAAFVGSLKRMNWRFDFTNFLKQPKLIEKHLSQYKDQMLVPNKDIIEEGSLLWCCIHEVINYYQHRYSQWIYKRHEDISANPIAEFKALYKDLGLEFTEKIEKKILQMTSFTNPSEVIKNSKVHQLKRNSKANINSRKTRPTPEEIQKVRSITEPIARHFYSDEDW